MGLSVRRAGADALLVECGSLAGALALRAEVERRGVAVRDLVSGACTVLLDGVDDPAGLADDIATWDPAPVDPAAGDLVEIPTTYDGPDLDDVARLWEVTTAEVVETHLATSFTVAFGGFAPGFAYLSGLDRSTPRLDSPRSSVPAGSVGLAGDLSGVYPRSSPGGWRLIGHTRLDLWDADREPPALLVPGTRVRFVRA